MFFGAVGVSGVEWLFNFYSGFFIFIVFQQKEIDDMSSGISTGFYQTGAASSTYYTINWAVNTDIVTDANFVKVVKISGNPGGNIASEYQGNQALKGNIYVTIDPLKLYSYEVRAYDKSGKLLAKLSVTNAPSTVTAVPGGPKVAGASTIVSFSARGGQNASKPYISPRGN